MSSITRLRRALLGLGATLTLAVGSLGFAASAGAASASIKPIPKAPQQNTISQYNPNKGHASAEAIRPDIAWTVSLAPSGQTLWPEQYATLTATANQNVGPTPYYIDIFDQTSGTYIAVCGTGTTCTASVTQPTAATHMYVARITTYPYIAPVTTLATSNTAYIQWRGITISLQANPTTVGIGGTTTLTSITSADIGPSPFYAEIFDLTTGTRIGVCGAGTVCTATTSQAVATTHKFAAYVSNYGTTNPPTGIQATSNNAFVTWSNAGYRVMSISALRVSYGHDTITATSNINVGPTPYYIEIFNLDTGARIGICGTGTSCTSSVVSLNTGANHFTAFISSADTALPPANTQASGQILTDYFFPITTPAAKK